MGAWWLVSEDGPSTFGNVGVVETARADQQTELQQLKLGLNKEEHKQWL